MLARVVPRDGRSRAYVDGRLATVGELAEVGRALVDLHGQHAHQSLLDPAVQRGALDRFAGAAALDARARYRDARAAVRAARRRARGPRRRRPRPRPRDRPAPLPGRRDRRRRARRSRPRTSRSKPRRRCSPTRSRTATALAPRVRGARRPGARRARRRGRRARRPGAVRRARGTRCAARRASWPTSSRSCATRSSGSTRTPSGVETVRARRHQLHELGRKYGDTLADVIALRRRGRRPGSPSSSGYEERAAALEGRRRASTRRRRRPRPRRSPPPAARPPSRSARAVEVHLRELAMPHAVVEVVVERRSRPTTVTTG